MYNRKDSYFKKAKKEGFRARSAYKLIELNKKYNLIKKGDKIIDIGCSPGSWLQVAVKLVSEKGLIIGVDILPIKNIKGVKFLQADISDPTTIDIIKTFSEQFDAIISDVAPKTSGIKDLDHEKSIYLNEKVLEAAQKLLKINGNFLCKLFQGEYFPEFLKKVNKDFEFVKCSKPDSSRKESREIYIIAKGFKNL